MTDDSVLSTSKTTLHNSHETANEPKAVNYKPTDSKTCREIRDDWLTNYPWLEYDG